MLNLRAKYAKFFHKLKENQLLEWFTYFSIFLIIKIILIFKLPLLDDEAYFITWGQSLEGGYYDHPPLIGWITWLLSFVSKSQEFQRFFPLLTIGLLSYLMYRLYRAFDFKKAIGLGLLFFVSLSSVIHVPILNDTAMLLFGGISLYFFIKDFQKESNLNVALCCLFMSIAFMAKYFAAFLGLVYLIAYIIKKRRRILIYLFFTILFVTPALVAQGFWNFNTCWNNIMFNVVNRHSGQNSIEILNYIATVFAMLNPVILWQAVKKRKLITESEKAARLHWFIALAIFGAISMTTLVGAHWLLVFLIAPYLTLFSLEMKTLKRLVRFSAGYSLMVAFIVLAFLHNAEEFAFKRNQKDNKTYSYYQHFFKPEKICEIVALNVPKDYVFMTDGYSPSSIFTVVCGYDVPVIFHKGVYGRQYDFKIDFTKYAGKNIAIYTDNHDGKKYHKYFEKVRPMRSELGRGDVKVLLGENFNYELYKKDIIDELKKKYYTLPDYLPYGKCYFDDR